MYKNAIKKVGRVKIRENSSWKLVFSPFFWAFSPVFFVLFSSDIRDFQEKCSGNTALKKEKNEKYYHEVDENVQEFLRYIFSQKSNEHEQHFICNLEMRRT